MPRHQTEPDTHTLAALETALAQLRAAGAPDDAELRARVSPSWSADGGHLGRITARWDNNRETT